MPDPASVTSRDDLIRAIAARRNTLMVELAALDHFLAGYDEGIKRIAATVTAPAPTTLYQDARAARMIAVLQAPNNGHTKWMAPYINHGYLTRSKKGVYTLTPKGRDKLASLQA